MSFPIIPGSRGGISAIAGAAESRGSGTGVDSGAASGNDCGDIAGVGAGDASGARAPQRMRTFMDGPLRESPARAAILIACRPALQNWSSGAPDCQDEDPGWRVDLVSSGTARAIREPTDRRD